MSTRSAEAGAVDYSILLENVRRLVNFTYALGCAGCSAPAGQNDVRELAAVNFEAISMPRIALNHALKTVWEYWQDKRGQRQMPARKDIDPIDIPKVLPHILLLELAGERLRCRLIGSAVAEAYGGDQTGKFLDVMVPQQRYEVVRKIYDLVLTAARPLVGRSNFITADANELRVTRLLLPLSDDGLRVNMILEGVATENPSTYLKADLSAETRIDPNAFDYEFL